MEEDDGDGGKQQSRVRPCIDAARYVLTALMAAVALAVVGSALAVSLRPVVLSVIVANGYASVSSTEGSNSSSLPSHVRLSLIFKWINPSGRAGIQYSGIKVGLLLNDGHKNTTYSFSEPKDIPYSVPPNLVFQLLLTTTLDKLSPEPSMALVRRLQRTAANVTATVFLSGSLRTKYTTKHVANYVCSQVTVGDLPRRQLQAADDVLCTQSPGDVPM